MANRKLKIVCFGEIVTEIMTTNVNQLLNEIGYFIGPYPSGSPAIFADQVAKLGGEVGIISAVGNDKFGLLNVDRLKKDHVDISSIRIFDDSVTGTAFVTYYSDKSRDFIFNIKDSAYGKLNLDSVNLEVLKDCMHFHVMGSSVISKDIFAIVMKCINEVKAKGGTISFDPNIRKELIKGDMLSYLHSVLEKTDFLLPSENEVTTFCTSSNFEDAIYEYLNSGIKEVIVKLSDKGAKVYTLDTVVTQSSYSVKEIDPTGAGDIFGGTYILSRLQGRDISYSLKLATACGAFAVTKKGPMEGTSNMEIITNFILEREA